MPLSVEDRQNFLSEPHIAALAIHNGADRAPLNVPIWYQYTPGGEPWILTGGTSRKAELIAAAGRFSLMVQRVEPTVRYVTVEGSVSRTTAGTDEMVHEMAHRYLTDEQAAAYIEFAKTQLPQHIAIHLRPEHWLSADLGG